MQNRYVADVADVGDFGKYGLLRNIAKANLIIGIYTDSKFKLKHCL